MRIGIVSPTFPPMPGGVSYYVYNLSKELVRKKHHVVVFTRGSLKNTYHINVDGIHVLKIPYIPIFPFHVYLHGLFVNGIFKRYEKSLDILHYHVPLPPIIKTSLPTIVTIHGLPEIMSRTIQNNSPQVLSEKLFSFIVYDIEKEILRRSDKITTVSKITAIELEYFYKLKTEIDVIGNGVDDTFFHPRNGEVKKTIVMYAGRLDYKKGLKELVDSAVTVCDEYPNIQYDIAGTGPFLKDFQDMINEKGIVSNFRFYGHVDRISLRKLYQQASIFLLPSYYEGLPNVILEAMACGLPIIATNVGGIPSVVKDKKNGFIIRPGDHQEITKAIRAILNDDALRINMGKNSRQEIQMHFSWNSISDKYIQVYEQLINQPARAVI